MKFTNVKQLIIKFMGGGLINFPTRFLRWVKINGDTEDGGSDDGGSGGDDSDPIRSLIEKMTYGVCSDYEIDEENYTVKVKEPNNVPRIYTTPGIFGYNYDDGTDSLTNYLGLNGANQQTKIVLNGEEIAFNDLFDGDKVNYKAIIVGYYDIDTYVGEGYTISMPIVYISIHDDDWVYFGQNSGIYADKNNGFMNYISYIRDAHFNPEH